MDSGVLPVMSNSVVTWFANPWVIRFDAAQIDNGLELLFSTETMLAAERTTFEGLAVVAQVFALRQATASRGLQLPLIDIDKKDGQISCRYGSAEDLPADLTLSIQVTDAAENSDGVAGRFSERAETPFLVCQMEVAIETEHELMPQLSFIHRISRVRHKEIWEVPVTSEDLSQKSVLSEIAFPAKPESKAEGVTTLSFLRYSFTGLEWSLISYYHPAGVQRISPKFFQSPPTETCQEVWSVFTFPKRLEKGVTAFVHAGFLLCHPSVSAVGISDMIRQRLVSCSPLPER